MKKRIYLVFNDNEEYLVRASNRAQALSFVMKQKYYVRLADQEDIVTLLENTPVLDANETPEPPAV